MSLNIPTLPGGLIATALEVAIHKPGQNPDHGEGVTHVKIECENGWFVVLNQPCPHDTRDGMAIDPDELKAVDMVVGALHAQPGAEGDEQPAEAPAEPTASTALAPSLATEAADTLRRLIGLLDAASLEMSPPPTPSSAELLQVIETGITQARQVSQRLQAAAIGSTATRRPFDVPPMNHTAQRKLSELIADGYRVCGVMISRGNDDGGVKLGAVSAGGMVVWWNPSNVPPPLGPLAKRRVYDHIRGAYDLGYNDSRNAKSTPGDDAPGYKGKEVEKDHGDALIHAVESIGSAA